MDAANEMKDEYVSVEHIVLGALRVSNSSASEILKKARVEETKFLAALCQVRGNQRGLDKRETDVL